MQGELINVATPAGAAVLRNGVIGCDDPQFDPAGNGRLAKLAKVREIAGGETVTLGPPEVTAHPTPGHTPGGRSSLTIDELFIENLIHWRDIHPRGKLHSNGNPYYDSDNADTFYVVC